MSVQWYPGHMTKARRKMKELLNKVDVVLEIRDARIPISSANPDIVEILGKKPKIIILNKADLADQKLSKAWSEYFSKREQPIIICDCSRGQVPNTHKKMIQQYSEQYVRHSKVTKRPMRSPRVLVVGIPNVGKSSLINALSGRKAARIGAKPGLTRGQQLINIDNKLQILDTPGVLWPKIDDQEAGIKLAATGAISDVGFSLDEIVMYIFTFMQKQGLSPENSINEYLQNFASRRGFLMSGNVLDIERAKKVILSEFRTGKFGRFTLEEPNEYELNYAEEDS